MHFRLFVVLSLGWLTFLSCKAEYPNIKDFGHNSIIQDPQTKINYYVETDRRHVAAISPLGSVLWCTEVISEKWAGKMFILKIGFEKSNSPDGHDCIGVLIWRVGQGGGQIDEQTGVYTDSGKTL